MHYEVVIGILALLAAPCDAEADNWYQRAFYLLHEDHHTQDRFEVGRDADLEATRRLVGLSRPDVIQIHAKGNPGWTTYPTKIGHAPPKLARDVMAVWRDAARRDGYAFSAYYNIGRDGVIMDRRPQWNRCKPDGTPRDRALCYHSGVAEAYLWPMVREILEGYRPDGFWFDGSCFTVETCYCDACRRRFDAESGLELPKRADEPGWEKFKEMQRQIYREFVQKTAAEIHRIDPKCLVAVNWAYSLRMPEKPDPGVAYLTGDIGNRVECLSPEAHWYDSLDLPFDLMTQVSTACDVPAAAGKPAGRTMAPKPRPQIEQEMAVIIANGGRYFAWDNPTPESGLVAERMQFLGGVVAPFLRARQAWCQGSTRAPDVSLLHSAAAHYAATAEASTVFTRRDNRIDGAAALLPRLHLNYEMVPEWRLAGQDVRSRLLVVEHPKRLTPQTVEALIAHVRKGGCLLMTGMGIAIDPQFRELFGIGEFTGPGGPESLRVAVADSSAAFEHWLFRLKLASAQPVLSVQSADGSSHPLLTRNRFGRGVAWYAAVPLLSEHGKCEVPMDVLEAVFRECAPPAERHATTTAPQTVEMVLRRQPGRYVLHLVNMAPGRREVLSMGTRQYPKIDELPPVAPCRISVKVPVRPSGVAIQPQGISLNDWRFADGRLEMEVPGFDVHQMVVIDVPE